MSEASAVHAVRSLGDALRNIELPRYDERQKLLGQRFEWRNDETHIRFTLSVHTPAGDWVHGLFSHQAVCIQVAPEQHHRIGERSWTDYDRDAQLMAWTLLHDDLLDAFGQIFAGPFTPISIVRSPASATPDLAGPVMTFEVLGDEELTLWRGTLALDDTACSAIIEGATASQNERAPVAWPALPLPIALRYDGPVVDASALRSCAAGDMIVIADRQRLMERITAFGPNGQRLPILCQNEADGVRITLQRKTAPSTTTNKETQAMSQTPTSPQSDTSLASQIPVRLAIQTAAVDVSLAELEQMESGMIVPLEAPVAGTNVTILANGAPIGDGELVAAGDKLAVCIRRWRPDGL
ncbi:MAG: FliM/FliN family flagellar motor switch protein [Gammaproteobacteria bacterium]